MEAACIKGSKERHAGGSDAACACVVMIGAVVSEGISEIVVCPVTLRGVVASCGISVI